MLMQHVVCIENLQLEEKGILDYSYIPKAPIFVEAIKRGSEFAMFI
jgi:hypothetical protein